MYQKDAVWAVDLINSEERRLASARDVAELMDPPLEDVKEAARTLLKATRNGRVKRRWMRGAAGAGCYGYQATAKGRSWLEWLYAEAA